MESLLQTPGAVDIPLGDPAAPAQLHSPVLPGYAGALHRPQIARPPVAVELKLHGVGAPRVAARGHGHGAGRKAKAQVRRPVLRGERNHPALFLALDLEGPRPLGRHGAEQGALEPRGPGKGGLRSDRRLFVRLPATHHKERRTEQDHQGQSNRNRHERLLPSEDRSNHLEIVLMGAIPPLGG